MRTFLTRLILFTVVLVVVLETFFRLVLPACEHPRSWQDDVFKITRFDPTWQSHGTRTSGRFAHEQGDWRINAAGWNSLFEYTERTDPDRPRIAVIGDSYVAGFAVDVDLHLAEQLYDLLDGRADVYAFGVPGAPLGHLVGVARYVEATYDADIYLIFAGHGAVEHSFGRSSPHRFCVVDRAGKLELEPPLWIYRPNPYGRFIYRSAVVRYLTMNRRAWLQGGTGGVLDLQQALAMAVAEPLPRDLAVARFLQQEMRSVLPEDHIVYFTDALRNLIYDQPATPPPAQDYRLLAATADDDVGTSLVDLTEAYRRDYDVHHQRFDDPPDPHWNARGHGVAAQALLSEIAPLLPGF